MDGDASPAMDYAAGATSETAGAPPMQSLAAPTGLGNIAQSARGNQLKGVRGLMIFVGLMTVAVNAFFYSSAEGDIQAEIDKQIATLPAGMVADPVKVQEVKEQALRLTRLINGGAVLMGMAFLGCAAMVGSRPVPATITALSLYIAGTAIFGMINPQSLGAGIFLKIIIIVTLAKSVQAAIAFQKEQAAEPLT